MDQTVAPLSLPKMPTWSEQTVALPSWTDSLPPRHVHILPSLSLGGAERIVVELARTFSSCGIEADVVVMRDADTEHALTAPGIAVHRLGKLSWPERIAYAAGLVQATRLPAYCHLTSEDELRKFWAYGVRTVPVVHNARDGWRQSPLLWEGHPQVPFVVACGDVVARDLAATGLTKPVRVFRHIVRPPTPMTDSRRAQIRSALGATDGALLVGMTGRFAVQKRYVRAVRILAALRRRGVDARLAIVGSSVGEEGRRCRKAVLAEAALLGVGDHLVAPGAIRDAGDLAGAYDVFINVSLFEGVSISTMEAVAAGVPVVSADVGGQREALAPRDVLMPAEADDGDWADAILEVRGAGRRIADHAVARDALASLWPWMLALGPGAERGRAAKPCDVLFVTGNLDVGGAQRSLCNLVAELPAKGVRALVAVAGPVGVPGFMDAPRAAGVEFIDVGGGAGFKGALRGRAGRILSLIRRRCPSTVAFWNLDSATKMAVAKVLAGGPVKVVDVSPGPMLYKELDAEARMASLLSTGPDAYVASLDVLVSKYQGGGPDLNRGQPRRFAVIPNGVPQPRLSLNPFEGPRPPLGADPSLAVVTVGRLTAAKRPELLPLVALALDRRLPGATLTVVGGTHGTDRVGSWSAMMDRVGGVLPCNLCFVGPDDRTTAFLPRFACFYMVSTDQGCPNASLEAMMSGLPVVANPDGGTAEQIEDGVNGRLVADGGDDFVFADNLAKALADVLSDPARARAMGEAGRARATERFSMAAMVEGYLKVLL